MSAKNFSHDALNSLLGFYKQVDSELPDLIENASKPENEESRWEKAESFFIDFSKEYKFKDMLMLWKFYIDVDKDYEVIKTQHD